VARERDQRALKALRVLRCNDALRTPARQRLEYRWEIDTNFSLQDPARRWRAVLAGPRVFDREAREWVTQPVECAGCLPRKAEHGLLCWHCWEKTIDALKIGVDMITHLRSVERAQQVDNAGVRSAAGWVIPVPNTWRTSDELLMLLGHPEPGFPSDANVWEVEAITERYMDDIDAEFWVSRHAGAEAAVRFYRLMQTAMAAHPMKEYEHRIRNVRCYKCKQRTLLWKPPLEHLDDIHVVCTNPRPEPVVRGRVDDAGPSESSPFEAPASRTTTGAFLRAQREDFRGRQRP
jgi:hypothetical protein